MEEREYFTLRLVNQSPDIVTVSEGGDVQTVRILDDDCESVSRLITAIICIVRIYIVCRYRLGTYKIHKQQALHSETPQQICQNIANCILALGPIVSF